MRQFFPLHHSCLKTSHRRSSLNCPPLCCVQSILHHPASGIAAHTAGIQASGLRSTSSSNEKAPQFQRHKDTVGGSLCTKNWYELATRNYNQFDMFKYQMYIFCICIYTCKCKYIEIFCNTNPLGLVSLSKASFCQGTFKNYRRIMGNHYNFQLPVHKYIQIFEEKRNPSTWLYSYYLLPCFP